MWTSLIANKFVVGAVIILATAAFVLFQRYQILSLKEKTQRLTLQLAEQKAAFDQQLKDHNEIVASAKEINDLYVAMNTKLDIYSRMLHRENEGKKSLNELARKKSSLIEKKINAASDAQLKCLEKVMAHENC